eukprot:jgi/Botrbrau1/4363/Bobra.105_2s0010.2
MAGAASRKKRNSQTANILSLPLPVLAATLWQSETELSLQRYCELGRVCKTFRTALALSGTPVLVRIRNIACCPKVVKMDIPMYGICMDVGTPNKEVQRVLVGHEKVKAPPVLRNPLSRGLLNCIDSASLTVLDVKSCGVLAHMDSWLPRLRNLQRLSISVNCVSIRTTDVEKKDSRWMLVNLLPRSVKSLNVAVDLCHGDYLNNIDWGAGGWLPTLQTFTALDWLEDFCLDVTRVTRFIDLHNFLQCHNRELQQLVHEVAIRRARLGPVDSQDNIDFCTVRETMWTAAESNTKAAPPVFTRDRNLVVGMGMAPNTADRSATSIPVPLLRKNGSPDTPAVDTSVELPLAWVVASGNPGDAQLSSCEVGIDCAKTDSERLLAFEEAVSHAIKGHEALAEDHPCSMRNQVSPPALATLMRYMLAIPLVPSLGVRAHGLAEK